MAPANAVAIPSPISVLWRPGSAIKFRSTVAGTSITLTALAIAAIAGIFLNAILPGNDYEFGKNPDGDASRGVYMMNTDNDEEEES